MSENWIRINTIPEYSWVDSEYMVSDLGNFRGKKTRYLQVFNQGMSRGQIWLRGFKHKPMKVYPYRIVAMAFIPNPYGKTDVNHLDEDTTNNRADNLEWVTKSENNRYGDKQKRAKENRHKGIVGIKNGLATIYSRSSLRMIYGKISPILRCCNAKYLKFKKYKGTYWSYVEPPKQMAIDFEHAKD